MGLAVARALSRSLDVILLEAHAAIGSQTSSRNSEVIHSGIYYAPGTLKAELTAPGCEALYTYLASRGVEHKRCGKIIVATNEAEGQEVERLLRVGEKNGVKGLHELSAADLTALEPQLSGHRGLLVPSTGIVDSHGLMLALQADAEDNGAVVVTRCSVQGAIVTDTVGSTGRRGISLLTSQGRFDADVVVNCAGHMAPSVAARIAGHPLHRAPQPYYCKGTYFKLQGNIVLSCAVVVSNGPFHSCRRREVALPATGVPGALATRPGRARHHRLGRRRQVWARHGVGRADGRRGRGVGHPPAVGVQDRQRAGLHREPRAGGFLLF